MKYEAVAQFSVTGHQVKSVRNLLDSYGIDYVILNSSGTGLLLSTLTCEIAILKPEPTELTPDRMFSFIMKFDEMVRIGKESHTLTPAQIDLAKSCDKVKLLKFLDDIWYSTKVAYVKIIAMLAQAYAIAYAKPDSTSTDNSGDRQKHNDNGTISPITMEVIIGEIRQRDPNIADKISTVFGDIPDDIKDALIQSIQHATISAEDMINGALCAGCNDNDGNEKNKEE